MTVAVATCVLAVASCGPTNDSSWMPLGETMVWKYHLRSGLSSEVVSFEVKGSRPSGHGRAFDLAGPGGLSRLAWDHDRLVAAMLAGTVYDPPLPLLIPNLPKDEAVEWKGMIAAFGKSYRGGAVIRTLPEDFRLQGRTEKTLRSEVVIVIGKQRVVLATWFARNIGIVRQEERVQDELLRGMDYLKGP